MKIRTLIVDDEELARVRIRELLARAHDVEVVGECGDGEEALAAVAALAPDLVFLDVQMPEMDGFEVLRALPARGAPVVVFVTAYDEFALRAFDAQAIDYLLKPVQPERFGTALERVRAQVSRARTRDVEERLDALLDSWARAAAGWSASWSAPAPASTWFPPRRWTGSKRRATTCACTPASGATCCAPPWAP
ncbi:MAG TPA: response regulator [Longimicrobium sp.]|jgi:two-component system LytT family response regulator